jgi:hypothetical protein
MSNIGVIVTHEAEHGCEPDHPCGGVFVCAACEKLKGWCCGAADELPDLCDDCATTCAHCGKAMPVELSLATIHRNGFSLGPEVPLCGACGAADGPSAEEIWYKIATVGPYAEARESGVPLQQLLRDCPRQELIDGR